MSESEALYFRVMQDSFRLIQPAANFLYEESKVNISKAQNLKSGQTASKRETETERDTQRDTQREIERDTHTHTRTHTETERQRQRDRERHTHRDRETQRQRAARVGREGSECISAENPSLSVALGPPCSQLLCLGACL